MKSKMKIMALLLCFIIAALATACSKEKDEPATPTILGQWNYVSHYENGTTYPDSGVWTFNPDGTLVIETGGVPASGTYNLVGDQLTWDFGYGEQELTVQTLTLTDLSISINNQGFVYNFKR